MNIFFFPFDAFHNNNDNNNSINAYSNNNNSSIAMPELPEVENFRSLLVPLISPSDRLQVELVNEKPPRRFLTADDIDRIHSSNCRVAQVLRKGKLICMVLEPMTKTDDDDDDETAIKQPLYLFLHMGMTGRISTPDYLPSLESLKDGVAVAVKSKESNSDNNVTATTTTTTTDGGIIPPHTYLKFTSGDSLAYFSDPRKFGFVTLHTNLDEGGFGELAPDALDAVVSLPPLTAPLSSVNNTNSNPDDDNNNIINNNNNNALQGLVGQSTGIKAILLDQKRVMSGVGNWIADEVLYQCQIHPDQTQLTESKVYELAQTLQSILVTAIQCLQARQDFPATWLFHCRWGKRNEGKVKDPQGRMVSFIKSAGRTSAIILSIQKKTTVVKESNNNNNNKKKSAKRKITTTTTTMVTSKEEENDDQQQQQQQENVAAATKRKRTTKTTNEDEINKASTATVKVDSKTVAMVPTNENGDHFNDDDVVVETTKKRNKVAIKNKDEDKKPSSLHKKPTTKKQPQSKTDETGNNTTSNINRRKSPRLRQAM